MASSDEELMRQKDALREIKVLKLSKERSHYKRKAVLSRRVAGRIYLSLFAVETLGRPYLVRRRTLLVSWKQFHILQRHFLAPK
ncbi:hypothetical protein TNCV_4091311 [Trichonephila clavipes]|nr:hypothetical protein TNCV_4091311 [Trichonephila clavipes]